MPILAMPNMPPQIQERIVCSISAALKYQVPANIILAVAEKEAGKPGQWVRNSNGTHDVGQMRFNTAYLKELRVYGITPGDVAFSYVGADEQTSQQLIAIAYQVQGQENNWIENAIGGSARDVIIGNDANNALTGDLVDVMGLIDYSNFGYSTIAGINDAYGDFLSGGTTIWRTARWLGRLTALFLIFNLFHSPNSFAEIHPEPVFELKNIGAKGKANYVIKIYSDGKIHYQGLDSAINCDRYSNITREQLDKITLYFFLYHLKLLKKLRSKE